MLPLLPVYIVYFAAGDGCASDSDSTCYSEKGKKANRSGRIFFRTVAFVIGFTCVFCVLGILAGSLGRFLNRHSAVVNAVCGFLVIAFGLSYMGLFDLPFLKGRSIGRKVESLASAFAFGCVYALSVSPCIGIFLGSALALASASATALSGLLLLFAYSMGLGIPFIVSAIAIDRFKSFFAIIKKHYGAINLVCGSILVVMGVLMIFGFGSMSWRGNVRRIIGKLGSSDSIQAERNEIEVAAEKPVGNKRKKNLLEIRRTSMNEIKLSSENFQKEVIESQLPVLVDFWAEWCGPCRMLSPIIADIADDYSDKIKVGKVNVDEQPELASKHIVNSRGFRI